MSCKRKAVSVGLVVSVLLAGSILLSGDSAWSAQQSSRPTVAAPAVQPPITEKELIKLVKHNKKHLNSLGSEIESRGLAFELTPDIEQKLQKAGADENFIANLKNYTPSGRAKGPSGPEVSQAEAQAYGQLRAERDPEKAIQETNDFARKFPNSSILTYVYALQAVAYQQKNDALNAVAAGEKSLVLDPKNLMALLVVSSILPQPQMLNVSDAEKEKRLNLAENYANKSLQEIEQLPKQPNETDKAYQARKDQMSSGVYASLGMVHLERSRMAIHEPDLDELNKAEQNYKAAIQKAGSADPADYYRLGEIYSSEGKLDDAISAFSNARRLAPGTVIEQYANKQIDALKAKKAQKAPAKP
jgi:tetratricopeptide (TPR) repeat protein